MALQGALTCPLKLSGLSIKKVQIKGNSGKVHSKRKAILYVQSSEKPNGEGGWEKR